MQDQVNFFSRLRQRNVFRIGTMYVVGSLLLLQLRNYDRDHGTATVDWQSFGRHSGAWFPIRIVARLGF